MVPRAIALLLALRLIAPNSAEAASGRSFQTSVVPGPDEDLASSCGYELTLLDPSRTIRGVWVIFERGRDMLRYYGDPDVRGFARAHDLALLMPFHCAAKSYTEPGARGEMNVDPSKGLGRALFAALTQLASASRHPELASAKVILLGFSGTGSLVARFAAYAPDRILAIIASDPGHFDPLGVDTIDVPDAALQIPQFIIAGAADRVSGTERPYAYFRKYFAKGAPWTFLVQNGTAHCCIINAKELVLRWLEAVVVRRLTPPTGLYGFIRTSPTEIDECSAPSAPRIWCRGNHDFWGGTNWSVTAGAVGHDATASEGMMPAGWLPTRAFAKEWRQFIIQPEHPIGSLP
jgi:dienelactone hydrolase